MDKVRRPAELGEGHEGLRAEQLFLVLNIIKQASRSLDPPTFFRLLAQSIYREIKTFSHVSVFEWDAGRACVRALAVAGDVGADGLSQPHVPPPGGLTEAIARGTVFVSNNLLAEARGLRPVAPMSRSALCIPIHSGERILALLNIESRETRVFGPADVALFEILAEHLANFLQGLTLFEELRDQSVKINRITEICRLVFSAASLEDALQVAVRAVVESYGCYCACVAFLSEDGRSLDYKTHHAQADVPVPDGFRQEIGAGIAGRVARERRTICCRDTSADPDYVAVVPDVRSKLCIPLLADGTLIGVLDLSGREIDAFDGEDVSLMETLARQLALVVDKARILEDTRRSRDYLENLIASAGDGILALDAAGRIIRWNLGMEKLTGYDAAEILGKSFREIPTVVSLDRAEKTMARVMAGETFEGVEEEARCKDGRIANVVLTMSPIRGATGATEGISVIVHDVTERRLMEESFREMHRQIVESEQRFLDLVEKGQDAIFFLDAADGKVVQANARAEAQSGLPRHEILGRSFLSLHPEQDRAAIALLFESAVGTGAARSHEVGLERQGGAPIPVEVTPGVLAFGGRNVVQWVCRDISDRRRAEEEKGKLQLQLLQTEKLSAIGQLISGVAHELNNPLTGVIGYSQLLTGLECDEKVKRGLETVYAEARRCHRIVQNLLTFARKHAPEKTLVSINDIIESTIELRSYQLRTDNVRVEMSLSKDLPSTMGDFHQLQQVFMNILNNAHHALRDGTRGGRLSVRTLASDDRIRIEFADDGPGIPAENLPKIFDPFFTTKPIGQGTGLGLSICFGIIEEHEGKIFVSSRVGEGAIFTIDLPILRRAEAASPADGGSLPRAAGEERRNGGKLLIVDDEPSIIEVLSEALTACGHEVDTAINGRLALKKILNGSYDLVITDLKMPGMDGRNLFDEVSRARPALAERFIFSTGDVIARETREFLESTGKPWVEKPFDMDRVVTLLGQMLAGEA